jgi:hypothetical protein
VPEQLRFDVHQDLPEDVRGPAIALMARIVKLQDAWITGGDDEAYEEWRQALEEMTTLIGPHRTAAG